MDQMTVWYVSTFRWNLSIKSDSSQGKEIRIVASEKENTSEVSLFILYSLILLGKGGINAEREIYKSDR